MGAGMTNERLLERSIPDRSPGHAFMAKTNWGAGLTIWVGGATSWGIGTVRFRPYDTKNRTLGPSNCQQSTSYTNEIWVNYAVHMINNDSGPF